LHQLILTLYLQDDKTQLQYLSKTSSVFAMEIINDGNNPMTSPNNGGVEVETWHTCNICFEEKFEEDLMVHRSCNGTLCSDCLEGTIQHNQNTAGNFPCPVKDCLPFLQQEVNEA